MTLITETKVIIIFQNQHNMRTFTIALLAAAVSAVELESSANMETVLASFTAEDIADAESELTAEQWGWLKKVWAKAKCAVKKNCHNKKGAAGIAKCIWTCRNA